MKLRKLMVLALVLALFVCAFVACGEDTDTETQAPDVTETDAPGTEAPETDPPETEHTHDIEVDEKAATCSDRGYKKEVCKTCGEVVSETAYPKAAHTPSGAATCDTESKCTVCGEVLEAAKGHTWGDAVTVEATCTAEGTVTKTCTVCNKTETKTLEKLAHNIPAENVTASVAPTCTTEGSKTGICTTCNTEQTVVLPAAHVVENLGDLSALTFVDGKIQGKCTSCGADVDVTAEVRLALTFDEADVPTELAKWATAENSFPLALSYNSGQAGTAQYVPQIVTYPDATDGHTSVYRIHHNASPVVWFNGSLLSDADYYVISFDWRATKISGTSNKIGSFGMANKFLSEAVSENDFAFAFKIDRSTGELYDTAGKNKFDLTATAEQWYNVTVVVDNATGTAYTYIDGTCYAVVENEKYIVTEDGEYTWRFGGLYQVFHIPEFDNFEVTAIVLSTDDVLPGGDDEEGGEEDDDPYNDGSGCAHEVWLDIIPGDGTNYGYIVETCKKCNKVVRTYMLIPECEHVSVTVVPTTEPTCEVDGEGVATCDTCGADLGVQVIPATDHTILDEDVTEYVASDCVTPGHVSGTCKNCGELVTIDLPLEDHIVTSLATAQIVDGKVQGKCDVCGSFVEVAENEVLVLDFENPLKKELENWISKNGLADDAFSYAESNYPDAYSASNPVWASKFIGGRSVLKGQHNCVSLLDFDTALLSSANYYRITFDWMADFDSSKTVSNQGIFGLTKNNTTSEFFATADRQTGKFYYGGSTAGLGGDTAASGTYTLPDPALFMEAGMWYTFDILVDNNTGVATVTIVDEKGNLFASYTDGGFLVEAGADYAFRFGLRYNYYHLPCFDNFRVVALDTVCTHKITVPVEVAPATCTVPGVANTTCCKCGVVLGTEEIPALNHADYRTEEKTPATCSQAGEAVQICNYCGVELGSEPLPMLSHTVGEVVDGTTYACADVVACSICNQQFLVEKQNAQHTVDLTGVSLGKYEIIDGKICGTCSVCGLVGAVAEDVRVKLDFDKSIEEELAAYATAENGLAWVDGNYVVWAPAEVDGRTVLKATSNTTKTSDGRLTFKNAFLSDASVYVISFDWRANKHVSGQGRQGILGVVGSNPMWCAEINRADGALSDKDGVNKYPITAEVGEWHNFVIVVNNAPGAKRAYVYIDGVLCRTYQNDFYEMNDTKTTNLGFRFGQAYYTHLPEFDNFKVSVIK